MDVFEAARNNFPHTKRMIYLEHAAIAPLSRPVVNAIQSFLGDRHKGRVQFDEDMIGMLGEVREKIATLIHAKPEEIALIPNTSTGLNIVAEGLPLQTGDRILVPNVEFPSNVYPYLNLKKKGIVVDFFSPRQGRVTLPDIRAHIRPQTKLLALSFVQFTNGFRADLEKIGAWCKNHGIWFAVDGIQGVGALPIDVRHMSIDFLAVGGHKWLMAPVGTGFLYIRPEWLHLLDPPFTGWLSVKNPWDLLEYQLDFLDTAQRFEIASQNFLGFRGLLASLNFLLSIGSEIIEERILSLTDYLVKGLERIGATVFSPRENGEKSGIVTFSLLPDNLQLHRELRKRHIFLSYRLKNLRASPHFYNNFKDLDTLLSTLEELV